MLGRILQIGQRGRKRLPSLYLTCVYVLQRLQGQRGVLISERPKGRLDADDNGIPLA